MKSLIKWDTSNKIYIEEVFKSYFQIGLKET